MHVSLIILLVLLGSIQTFAQDGKDTSKNGSDIKRAFDSFQKAQGQSQVNKDTLLYQLQQLSNERFKTELALEKSKQRELEDNAYAMRHRWRSFDFQYNVSIIIFILVIVIVFCGLFFSGWQFRLAMKQLEVKETVAKAVVESGSQIGTKQPQPEALALPSDRALNALKNELEVSTTGIKVNSSVLGVIILVLSIVFFYFYLLYVYPIKFVPAGGPPEKTDSSSVKAKP